MSVMKITGDNFEEKVLRSEKKILLDFWASWCGPCKMIAPIVEEIAEEDESIAVGKVNVDEESELAIRFGITSIPTLVVMEKGKITAQMLGYRQKAEILKLLGEN